MVYISFSNRVFVDKAVAGWTGKSDIEHIERVGGYVYLSKMYDIGTLKAWDLSTPSPKDDPLYAVTAVAIKSR